MADELSKWLRMMCQLCHYYVGVVAEADSKPTVRHEISPMSFSPSIWVLADRACASVMLGRRAGSEAARTLV